jgi:hypothetical protein
MWQVVTASQNPWLEVFAEQKLAQSAIDELLEALAALTPNPPPVPQFPAPVALPTNVAVPLPPQNRRSFKPAPVRPVEVVTRLELPRQITALPAPTPPSEEREQLLKLRTTILLAAEQQQVRSVLLCGAEPGDGAAAIAVQLSRSLAEYQRLRVAYLEVVVEDQSPSRKVLPFGYTFQLRRTNTPNLYEIASSLGAVRLDDWLKWWEPTVVLREMKKMFDVILIHAPALTTNAEVALLAGAVDGVILVATENVTAYATIAAAQQQLEAAQARILGVTLTQAAHRPSAFSVVKTRVREWMGGRTKTS